MERVTFKASDDDNNNESNIEDSVVGTWIMDDPGGLYSCGWKFDADGKCMFGEWMYKGTPYFNDPYKIPYSISGDTLYIIAGPESASFTYSISSNGKTLTLTATSSGDDLAKWPEYTLNNSGI